MRDHGVPGQGWPGRRAAGASPWPAVLTVLVMLRFTLPSMEAHPHPDSCAVPSPIVEHGLATVELRGQTCAMSHEVLLLSKSVVGMEGRPDSLAFDPDGCSWWLHLYLVDHAGNRSCPSNPTDLLKWRTY